MLWWFVAKWQKDATAFTALSAWDWGKAGNKWINTIHLLALVFKKQQQQHRIPPGLWRDPHISGLALRSAIDCCDGPPGAASLIDSRAARHRSSSLLYSPGVQNRPIHPGPISQPYPFSVRPRQWICPLVLSLWDCRVPVQPLLLSHSWEPSGRRAYECTLLIKNEGENTPQEQRQRERELYKRTSEWLEDPQSSQRGSAHQGSERAHREGSFRLERHQTRGRWHFWMSLSCFQWSSNSDCSITWAQLHWGPVKPLATCKQVMLELTAVKW